MNTKNKMFVDRRIQKTKKALTEALIPLILEKGYENITIQDIIDRANVGRSTFYMHYESKEQLLLDGHNNLNEEMFPVIVNGALSFENMFRHIAQNHQLAKAMLGKKSGNIMTGFFKNNIVLKIKKFYGPQFDKRKPEQKKLFYFSEAAGAAVISLVVCWVEDGMPFSVEEISLNCKELVNAVFGSLVNN